MDAGYPAHERGTNGEEPRSRSGPAAPGDYPGRVNEILSNPKAGRVRAAAALARKKTRQEQGRFLVEGLQSVRELLVHRPELAETVYVSIDGDQRLTEVDRLVDDAERHPRRDGRELQLIRVTAPVLAALAETVTPQGVVVVARSWESDDAEERARALRDALDGARLVAIMHEVRDPGNAGTVLRAADAAGADAVVFAGASIDPFHPKVVRSTTGSLFHLPVVTAPDLATAVDAARAAGLAVLAADVNGEELAPNDPALAGAVAWVFGNEARGLTEEDRALADSARRLPIYGAAESLNLATAASVCLYTTAFAQRV